MASDETLLGTFSDLSGEIFDVLVNPSGNVMLRGDQDNSVFLGREELVSEGNELRELLREILHRFDPARTERLRPLTPSMVAGWIKRANLSTSPDGGGGRDAT